MKTEERSLGMENCDGPSGSGALSPHDFEYVVSTHQSHVAGLQRWPVGARLPSRHHLMRPLSSKNTLWTCCINLEWAERKEEKYTFVFRQFAPLRFEITAKALIFAIRDKLGTWDTCVRIEIFVRHGETTADRTFDFCHGTHRDVTLLIFCGHILLAFPTCGRSVYTIVGVMHFFLWIRALGKIYHDTERLKITSQPSYGHRINKYGQELLWREAFWYSIMALHPWEIKRNSGKGDAILPRTASKPLISSQVAYPTYSE